MGKSDYDRFSHSDRSIKMMIIVSQVVFFELEGKIDKVKSGFKKGYSAIDNKFSLQSMVQKYKLKKWAFLLSFS